MNNIETIPLLNLAFSFIPVFAVLAILYQWTRGANNASYALFRMLLQLLLIGYLLNTIFASDSVAVTLSILAVMIVFSSWIALGTVKATRIHWLSKAIMAIVAGGGLALWLVIQVVLELQPWYQARYVIPLAGMIFAASMNSISLAADRFLAERMNGIDYLEARNRAFHTAMIPTINGLFAVGLVSLPGMMTGQILSGVSPFIAARYQIMVMTMLFSASGLSAACFLSLLSKYRQDQC